MCKQKIEDRDLILQGTEDILTGIIKAEYNALLIDTECFSKSRKHSREEFMKMIKDAIKWVTGKDIEIDEDLVVTHIKYLVENIVMNVTCDIDDDTVVITVNRDM